MEPEPTDDGCVGRVGIYHDKIYLHYLWASLDGQPNHALWNEKLPVEAYQRRVIGHQIFRF